MIENSSRILIKRYISIKKDYLLPFKALYENFFSGIIFAPILIDSELNPCPKGYSNLRLNKNIDFYVKLIYLFFN